jgi:uncharacterized protein (TIGR02594 family)
MKQDIRPIWTVVAYGDLGIHEIAGHKHNQRVLDIFRIAGHPEVKDDETAWCAAAMDAWLISAGLPAQLDANRKGTLWALDYLKYGVKLTKPALGAIGVKKRYNSAGKLVGGHVFQIVGYDPKTGMVKALGANQSDSVCVMDIPLDKVAGIRWPANVPLPTPEQYDLPATVSGSAKAGGSEA